MLVPPDFGKFRMMKLDFGLSVARHDNSRSHGHRTCRPFLSLAWGHRAYNQYLAIISLFGHWTNGESQLLLAIFGCGR